MKLCLLILTMPTRKEFLARLWNVLSPQLDHLNATAVIRLCDPQYPLGENREMLRRASVGDYIAFVDDDDLVSPNYVSTVLPLLGEVDQVGFKVQTYFDGVPGSVTVHSLKSHGWSERDKVFYRDITHLNPMRRELALSEPMEGGHGEDCRWADRMRGKVKTEHFVDKILYHYFFRSRKERAEPCPKCKSPMTVKLETESACNACGNHFQPVEKRLSCLWD